jgi:hypothetical protein
MQNASEIFEELWLTAQEAVYKGGYLIAPECEADLRSLIESGTARLEADAQVDAPAEIQAAKQRIEQIVAAMIEEAKTTTYAATEAYATAGVNEGIEYQPEAPLVLHEHTLLAARVKLCPCYPFC